MKKIVFMFPGQGAQCIGMGKDLYENSTAAKKIFDSANEILNKNIKKLCFEGPEDVLKQTVNTQSCILTVSIAALEAFMEKTCGSIRADYAIGHSLGEYSAMYAAGVLDLENALLAIQERSNAMQAACEASKSGAMAAIIGCSEEIIKECVDVASNSGLVSIANYNEPAQTVITGEKEAVTLACNILKEKGARKVVPLAVSGGFHSKLMKNAGVQFTNFVKTLDIKNAATPVVTNVDAEFTTMAEDFMLKMPAQISNSVLWYQSVQKLIENGADTFIEFGPGRVLSGLNRKICKEGVSTYNVSDMNTLQTTFNELNLASV